MFTGQYSNFKDWKEVAERQGYIIEQEGNKFIAHSEGVERGIYDHNYGGSGFGWFED